MKLVRRCAQFFGALVVLACASVHAANAPVPGAVNAQTVKLPDGPGSVRGLSDSPSVNTFSAQISYSVPFELPKASGQFAPQLGLSYSGDLGNGPVGLGWSLSSAGIRRSLRLGVPAYRDSDELELSGVAGGGRLVALPDGTWRVESSGHSTKVEREGSGFLVTVSGGVRLKLGVSSSGRQEEAGKTAAWFVEEVVHPTDQKISFSYAKNDGQIYLSTVSWGPAGAYQAELVYEARTDRSTSYRTGESRHAA